MQLQRRLKETPDDNDSQVLLLKIWKHQTITFPRINKGGFKLKNFSVQEVAVCSTVDFEARKLKIIEISKVNDSVVGFCRSDYLRQSFILNHSKSKRLVLMSACDRSLRL